MRDENGNHGGPAAAGRAYPKDGSRRDRPAFSGFVSGTTYFAAASFRYWMYAVRTAR